ncbi:MAG: hypothetical protein FJZ13_00735 [Candidatus Omnitrophica bacterium]|nr:hypothetical protein [Candidatus Omnitrophota bacterium]
MGGKIRLIVMILGFVFLLHGSIAAQTQSDPDKKKSEKKSAKEVYKECMRAFDINSINMNDSPARQNSALLDEYFTCKAVVKNDKNICDNLAAESYLVGMCKDYYEDYVEFLGAALTKGSTSAGMSRCLKSLGDRARCSSFFLGLNKNDSSVCDSASGKDRDECKAQVEGIPDGCPSESCQYKSIFVDAVRSKGSFKCKEIKNDHVRGVCRGYIGRNENVCTDNKAFQDFKHIYCSQKSRGL